MDDVLLSARDLTKSFATRGAADTPPALRGVSLDVRAGEFVSIVGPSGSGKSTLLYCLSGLELPTSGTVEIGGVDISRLSPNRRATLRRERVGFVFQSYNLIPSLTVRENVALPARLSRRPTDDAAVDGTLARVGLAALAKVYPGTLSGGQQQRVAIARVLATAPDVVFADEPTGALDTAAGSVVLDLLREAAADGHAVVMVTHDLDAAARADRVLVIRDGALHRELARPTSREIFDAVEQSARRSAS
ncbi:ABC transporter ATP-binding protein [Conyzicola nivalis]|uniref:ABC transporter ATP-binding protein n=1 Tax=Conyzicola nivalis TaxID=1477021 RepID=A0A916SIF4_9MICO|nr:ABC transporter ATP-binding protein [Conyzicola nivalis]GGB01948.1 ABC transporter ATP-binding protein [Conyzicola nivalis]